MSNFIVCAQHHDGELWPGKDGGIDFRFSVADQDVVVQAKHHIEGGARSLLRAAMKEDCKVLKLAPRRYILVTSLSLTPALKSKIIQAMPSTPVCAEDIIGRENLNNFLGLHPRTASAFQALVDQHGSP